MNLQEELNALRTQLDESRNIAYQAMNYSSDLGAIVLFIEESFSISDERELIDSLLGTLAGLELVAVAGVFLHDSTEYFTRSKEITKLERDFIDATRWEHRIASEDSVTAFNYDHVSCLIRNMPIDNEERYGMLKDTIATLLNGVEARLRVIEKDQRILKTQENLLALTEKTVWDFQSQFSEISSDATKVMGDLMYDMRGVVMELDVTGPQEQEILSLINSHVGLITKITERCDSVEKNFDALRSTIDRISDECEVEESQPSQKPARFANASGSIELFEARPTPYPPGFSRRGPIPPRIDKILLWTDKIILG